jgi:hypothetical protein
MSRDIECKDRDRVSKKEFLRAGSCIYNPSAKISGGRANCKAQPDRSGCEVITMRQGIYWLLGLALTFTQLAGCQTRAHLSRARRTLLSAAHGLELDLPGGLCERRT